LGHPVTSTETASDREFELGEAAKPFGFVATAPQ
jgi:hypothetical protein